MADIFISYRSDDRGAVEDLVKGLLAEDHSVWWDQGIAPSTEWRTEIVQRLAAAKAVVVVWSRNSVQTKTGKWVIQEAEEADRLGRLVPVCIDDVLPPLGLRHVQACDLIDWRGDRDDPRWHGFLETVRAKLEGREVDGDIARKIGPPTASTLLRGRIGLLFLVTALAALFITTATSFGPVAAAALAGGLALAYVALNLLFSRRRNERAGATFLRRAFATGWVTITANLAVWTAAAGFGAWPFVKPYVFPEFSIAVYDELRQPLPDAQVIVALEGHDIRVRLGADGIGRISYPAFWGPQSGTLTIRHNDFEATHETSRQNGRFPDLSLGAPSGVERLRVSHITLEELAIDMALQGRLPPDLGDVFPRIAGVVRNDVWVEADAYLHVFPSAEDLGGSFYGTEIEDGSSSRSFDDRDWVEFHDDFPDTLAYRWPQELLVQLSLDLSNDIVGCQPYVPLDSYYSLTTDHGDWEPDTILPIAGASTLVADAADDDGVVDAILTRMVEAKWLSEVFARGTWPDGGDEIEEEMHRSIAQYLIDRSVPPGVLSAQVSLTVKQGCDAYAAGVNLVVPPAALRISIVENVSNDPLPISELIEGVAPGKTIVAWAPSRDELETVARPWPLGMLQPGEAIIVPRRLLLEGLLTPAQVREAAGCATGNEVAFEAVRTPTESFSVYADGSPAPLEPEEEEMLARQAQRFTLRAGQVNCSKAAPLPTPYSDEGLPDDPFLYVAGPSVETLAISINGVEFAQREDSGVVLALRGGYEFGSCPVVFAASPGQPKLTNRGPIISDYIGVGSEGVDRIYLGRTVERVEIREVEPEISQLDAVSLVVRDRDGRERRYAAAAAQLRSVDRHRQKLEQGDVLVLAFPGYTPRPHDEAVYLEAVGYYTPLRATVHEMAQLWRAGLAR